MSCSNKPVFLIIIFSILYLFHSGETKCVPRTQSFISTPPEAAPPQENSAPASPPPKAAPPRENSASASPVTVPPPVQSPRTHFGGAPPSAALMKICANTDYPTLCLSTLTPFVTGNALQGGPMALLEASINAAVVETKVVIGLVENLINKYGDDPDMVTALNDCKDNYNDALDNYKAAMDAIPSRDIGTINSMLSAAVTDYGSSDDEFAGESPMKEHDTRLSNMADNCLAIVSLIK